jgi:signal transduction histidine kinase
LLNGFAAGLTLLALCALLVAMAGQLIGLDRDLSFLLTSLPIALIGLAAVYLINRYGSSRLASWLLLFLITTAIILSDRPEQVVAGRTTFVLAIPILMASVLLRPWAGFVMAGLISLLLAALSMSVGFMPNPFSAAGLVALALIAWLSARSLERALQSLQRRNRELTLLNRANRSLSSSLDLDRVLATVLEEVRRLMNVAACSIWLIDPETDELVCRQATGPGREIVLGWRLLPHQGLARWSVDQDQSLIIADTWADERHYRGVDEKTGISLRSLLTVPLRAQARVLGVLQVGDIQVNRFDAADLQLVESLAGSAAIAIEKAQLFEATRRQAEQLESLRQASLKLTSSLKLHSVLEVILQQALTLVEASDTHIFMYDGEELTFGAALWADGRQNQPYAEPRPHGLTYTVARSGERIVIPDVNHHPLFQEWPWGGAIAGLPLRFGQRLVGVMTIAFEKPHTFDENELRVLELFADQATVAIQNAHLYQQVEDHADELEARVAERTRELREAYEQLKELDRLKSKFVSDVSHELRTPVANIGLYLHLLENGEAEKREQYVGVLKDQSNRLARLIQDILSLSRLDTGEREVALAPVDLNALIEPIVAAGRPHAEVKDLALHFAPDPDLPSVQGSADELNQVITNLLSNAINYTPGGAVRVSTALDADREAVILLVEDTGIGIEPEDLPHIFERFYRGNEVGSSNIPGTGLGLSIAQEIVHRHGGRIEVKSRPGRGSTFRVNLPLHPPPCPEGA